MIEYLYCMFWELFSAENALAVLQILPLVGICGIITLFAWNKE